MLHNAKNGFFIQKNKKDHRALRSNCIANIHKALFTAEGYNVFLFQIIPAATPIKIYNTVHTGANIQLGGLKAGFVKKGYHVEIPVRVAILADIPTAKQISTQIIIFLNRLSMGRFLFLKIIKKENK